MKRFRSTGWVQTGLITAAVLLAVAGLVLLGLYFRVAHQPKVEDVPWVDPQRLVRADLVAPDLAVLTLAGEPDDRIVRAALDAGELETAYAALAYSVLLSDAVRSGHWLLLADAYRPDDPQRAVVAQQAALDLLALGAGLGDSARAEISLQLSRGYSVLERPELSAMAAAQAEDIARHSVSLLPAQRRNLLTAAAATYDALGQPEGAEEIRRNIARYSAGPGVVIELPPLRLPTLRGAIVLPPEVAVALGARQQAAAAMAARWLAADGGEREGLARALGDALLAEESARDSLYAASDRLALADRLALTHDRIAWLTTKLRVARGAYGASLRPEWEGQSETIATQLTAAYTELINGYGQQLDTLDIVEAPFARLELLCQSVLAVRLGLLPDPALEAELGSQLVEASRMLGTRQGGVGLIIVRQEHNGLQLYRLTGFEPASAGA